MGRSVGVRCGLPNAVLPLSADDLALWKGNLEKARQIRKTVQTWWDANLKAYAPAPHEDPDEYGSKLNTNRDFTLVERKKADLFYQRPDLTAIAGPLFDGQEALIDTHATILNEKLGLDGVHAKDLAHRVLFDILCPAGVGWTVLGYENVSVPVPMQIQTGTQPAPGAVLGLGAATPTFQTVMQPSPVFEDVFWSWLSPRQALAPHDLRTTLWDKAPWLAYDFEIPLKVAKRKGWLPANATGSAPDSELRFDYGIGNTSGDAVARGTYIYYQSAIYRDDRPHPQHYTLLILMDGQDTPAVHEDSPFQTLTPKGELSPDSLLGNCIHPCTLRVLTDTPYIPSDCTISRPLVNELNRFRGQMVEQRDANILRWKYNTDVMPTDALAKIVRSPIGGMIGLPGDAFAGESIQELPHGSYPRENFSFNDYLDNDLARTHALDAEQAGVNATGDQTATEASIKQSNVNARLGLERGVFLDWYIRGATKYSQLLMRFLPVEQAAKIVGPQAAQQWDSWRKQVPAALAFTAMANSTLRQDTAADLDRLMKYYTYFANDPAVNRQQFAKELLKRLGFGSKVFNPQPPQKQPEPTKPGFAFKGDDLNPLNPQFALVIAIAQQCGITIPPEAITEAQAAAKNSLLLQQVSGAQAGSANTPQTEHGGKVAPMESLDKHQAEQTGGMPGTGTQAQAGSVM